MCVWGGGAPGDVQAEGAALCSLQPEMPVRGGDREGTAQRCTGLSLWEGEGQRAPRVCRRSCRPGLHWFSSIVPSSVQPCLEAAGCLGEGFGVQVSWSPTFIQ